MKVIMTCLVSLLVFFSGLSSSWAIPDSRHQVILRDIRISGPADRNPLGTIFFNSGSQYEMICKNPSLNYNLARVEYTPLLTYRTDSTIGQYFYESGLKGISLGPRIRGDWFNVALPGNGVFSSAPPVQQDVWKGMFVNSDRLSVRFTVFNLLYIARGAERIENAPMLPLAELYRYTCYDDKNVAQETDTFYYNARPIYIDVTGCTPDVKATTINMEGVAVANIENAAASTLIGTKQQTFSLKCDPSIVVRYSVVDLNNPTNNTTTSTLTPDSTAAGVGYAITSSNGARLQFGPDGSAVGVPGQTKYLLGVSGTATSNNPMSLQLGFSYVRKPEEALKTGSAKSLIGITYSYQ